MIRYRSLDLPPGAAALAFTPPPAVNPVASSYGMVHITGSPGTRAIPSPRPVATPDVSMDPLTVPSNCAPDLIFPAIYTVDSIERPPVPTRNHNNLPIPAVNPGRVALPVMNARKTGGRGQIPWPRVFQRFPSAVSRTPTR